MADLTSKITSIQLDRVSASPPPPALKLPQLFSLTPNSSGKAGNLQKRQSSVSQANQIESMSGRKSMDEPSTNNSLAVNNPPRGFYLPL